MHKLGMHYQISRKARAMSPGTGNRALARRSLGGKPTGSVPGLKEWVAPLFRDIAMKGVSGVTTKGRMAGLVLLAVSTIAPVFAQDSGADLYKAKCQMCHGAAGLADSGAGKAMNVKPATDPSVKKMTEAEMIAAVTNGMGKMQAFKGKLTDAQIKDSVAYFRTFVK
jgi:mono/diheme cytochrome c family protein